MASSGVTNLASDREIEKKPVESAVSISLWAVYLPVSLLGEALGRVSGTGVDGVS